MSNQSPPLLPAGPRKLLLIDHEATERNSARRTGRAEPIVRVVVDDAFGPSKVFRAQAAKCLGEVCVEYSQHGFIAGSQRAALVTYGAVELSGIPAA